MSRQRLTVVLSQAPGKHPAKRALEETLAANLLMEPGIDLSIVPNLYDLGPDHTGRMYLEGVTGDLCIVSWLYPRAAYWLLDRIGIRGEEGTSLLKPIASDDEADDTETEPPKGIGSAPAKPDRHIYCLDLRERNQAEPFITEVRRIAAECAERRTKEAKPSFVQLGLPTKPTPEALLAAPARRWYPVIDYSRCTNCMECLDFCLFGVYNTDSLDRILVENQDSCKKGCPACSRVCPEQAIMFPEYKTPAIAGAAVGAVTGLKIDLSKLFGGDVQDALTQAVAERDRELVADGRTAVGAEVGLSRRQTAPTGPKDDLDKLMDDLDALGL